MRTPYVQNFNLNLQQQVGSRMVAQIGYVGSKGTKLFQFLDINQPSQAQITAADLACVPDHRNRRVLPVRLRCSACARSQFLLPEPGEVLGELHLPRAAGQPAHQQLAWSDLASQLCLVAFDRHCQRPRRLRAQRGAAAEQHESGGRSRQLELRHPQSLHLELHLRASQGSWRAWRS